MSNLNSFARPPPPAPAASSSGVPGWALLDSTTYVTDVRNETTAGTLTKTNLAIHVSFVFANPPRLSQFCVWCPNLDDAPFSSAPTVVCSVEDTALIRVFLATKESAHYGPGLDGQYYNLHTMGCSEPHSTWSKKLLRAKIPTGFTAKSAVIHPTKVIDLGDGFLGWVDLSKGILICNVLNDTVATTASFVPMPKLLPSNRELYGDQYSGRAIRDVTFSHGYIKCVEFEELVQLRATTVHDPWDMPELHDSDLASSPPHDEEEAYDVVGWRLITWYRATNSDGWRRGNMVHSDDLVGTVSLPQPGGGALNVPFKNLKTASPTLCGDDDVVYLVSMLHEYDQDMWIVAVDTKNGDQLVGKRNTSDIPPSSNFNKSKKQRFHRQN
ncbi:unnamed protein product [Alopecurus aequalis]